MKVYLKSEWFDFEYFPCNGESLSKRLHLDMREGQEILMVIKKINKYERIPSYKNI